MKRFFVLLVLFLAWAAAYGQGASEIRGRVTDERNATVAGAEVRLVARSGATVRTSTDASGDFIFRNVAPDDYLLEVKATGFASLATRVHVSRGQALTKDVSLSIEAVNETVIVTPNGTAQRADETSKAITVLDSQAIESRREVGLSESLRGVPGVRVQQQGSPGALTTLRIRGQEKFDTAILLDGLRVRDASDINGAAVPFLPDLLPAALDRVEVLRGSGSSIYGTNAVGGVINLVPETGSGRPHFEFGFDGGSLALFRERIKGAGGIGSRSGFSFGLTRVDVRRGVDGNDEYGNTGATGRWQFNARPGVAIIANFYGTSSNARVNDSPFALPAAFSGTHPNAIAGTTFQPDFNNPDQGRRNRMLVESIKLVQQINSSISYSVAYQHVGTRRQNYNGPRIDPQFASALFYPFGEFEFIGINNGGTDTFDARANFRLGRHNLATTGFEYERESIFQSNTPSFSAFNNTTDRQRTLAVFGQDQIYAFGDRLQISVAARSQWFRVRAADRPGFLNSVSPESSFTGDGSIAYFIRGTGTKMRGHIGNGFRAPSLFERFGAGVFAQVGFVRFGDPTLRPEQSISVDGGFDQRIANDRARFGATYFYTRLQRTIVFRSFIVDPVGAGRVSGYINETGGLSRGLETYAEIVPWRNGNIRASYTYTNSDRYEHFGGGLRPEYVIPKNILGLDFSERYRAIQINFDVNYTGKYLAPVFENNFPFRMAELTFPGYTKADLFVSYKRQASERVTLTFFGGADNLFDVSYFENGFRAPGIMARGGLNISLR